jgi:hypothetical protein
MNSTMTGKMIMYDGFRGDSRTIKMRPKRENCPLCGVFSIKELQDYVQFCGMGANDKDAPIQILSDEIRGVFIFRQFFLSYILL